MPLREILNLGKVLKQKRKEKNLTLRRVAEKAGVSPGLLSLIENGATNPSIATLLKITEAMEAPISSLFPNTESDKESYVLRSHERKKLRKNRRGSPYSFEYLAHDKNSNSIKPFWVNFDTKNQVTNPQFYHHRGQEFLYVIKGRVEFITKNENILLQKGDSIYFRGDTPHLFRRKGRGNPECIAIIIKEEDIG